MKPFLQRLAEEIAAHYGDDPSQVCVVLPNRRAGLYLKKYLAAELQKTAWAPFTVSIEDFITELSGCKILDQAGLLFEFYHVYKEIQGEKAQGFEQFADWAPVLLQDFNEIDQYLADPEKIFNYLNAARALSVWNLNEQPLTDHEKSYIEFYRSFFDYYRLLRKNLSDKHLVYQGLAYRIAAEKINAGHPELIWKMIFFAGLNALSAAEELIIGFLQSEEKAKVYWDADAYYIRDKNQEAGEFIRNFMAKWPAEPVKWLENDFKLMEKTIHVYGIPGSMGQAEKAGQIINQLKSNESAPDKTALVLADEKLLLPVLFALPEEIGPVNVTMGYPFRYTHLYQLVNLLFQMHENAEKSAEQRKSPTRSYYVKDIIKVLAHPYLLPFETSSSSGQMSFGTMREVMNKKNRVFMAPAEILGYSRGAENEFGMLNKSLFRTWESPSVALDELLNILELIRDRIIDERDKSSGDYELDLEYLFHLSRLIKKCLLLMESYPFINNLKTLRRILIQLLESSRLPFSGEPLMGLQVMGVLETRAIDFENIIVLSVNEGILPSGRLPNSFIPYDIKSEFGLPTFRHKDAVFAYHFYHMLQRAKNIYLLYDTEGDQMKGGEKSRFIIQLGYELTRFNPGTRFTESLLRPNPPAAGQVGEISITKTPSIMQKLTEKSLKGFSPTALNLYIKCRLQFYLQEILGLSEAETIEETIEAKTMGTVIHHVFQKVYEPFSGKYADADALTGRLKETEKYMREAFREYYGEGDLDHGKNHLVYKASLFLVNQFIGHEAEQLISKDNPAPTLKIIALENSFDHQIRFNQGLRETEARIKGKVDRIDHFGEITRIIDYKTGSVQTRELNLKSWDKLISDPKMAKAFQLLLYAWLYFKNNGDNQGRIQTGNITLRKISSGFMKVKLPGEAEINQETMDIFEGLLADLLEDIFNSEIPFTQTEDADNCIYCPFKEICTR